MVEFPIVLDPESEEPLYHQLYEALRQSIGSGALKPGEPLPSTRDFARKLGISRDTVLRALELLMGHGYLETHQRSSTRVRSNQSDLGLEDGIVGGGECPSLPPPRVSLFASRVAAEKNPSIAKELNAGGAPIDELPTEQWRRLLAKHLRHCPSESDIEPDPLGYWPLRETVAAYLNRFRSLRCHPRNLIIFAGPMSALDFAARLLVDQGDLVAVENPGFRHARRLFSAHGARLLPIAVDDEGMRVEDLDGHCEADGQTVRIVHVTPAHQDPTGAVLPLKRRQQLLHWAQRQQSVIIEDGYDSEYWYRNRPLPALQGLDGHQSVIYISSFWRALFPFSRVSYAILPDRFMASAAALKEMLEREVPIVEQRTIRDFILEGYLERYLRRSLRLFSRRRQLLVMSLGRQLGGNVWLARESAGMHLMVAFKLNLSQAQILACAEAAGLPLISTDEYYVDSPAERQFIIPFGHMADEKIVRATEQFKNELSKLGAFAFPEQASADRGSADLASGDRVSGDQAPRGGCNESTSGQLV